MYQEDVARMERQKKLDKEYSQEPLMENFVYFAKEGDYYSDGRTMKVTNLIRWMKQAEIFNGESFISVGDAVFLFKRLYT
jgi:hypothetical protein